MDQGRPLHGLKDTANQTAKELLKLAEFNTTNKRTWRAFTSSEIRPAARSVDDVLGAPGSPGAVSGPRRAGEARL